MGGADPDLQIYLADPDLQIYLAPTNAEENN